MTDELSIEELLQAAEAITSKQPSRTEVYETVEITAIITCNCGVTYHTIATRRKDWSEFYKVLEYKTLDCPKCMTVETWLYNHFTAKEVQ